MSIFQPGGVFCGTDKTSAVCQPDSILVDLPEVRLIAQESACGLEKTNGAPNRLLSKVLYDLL
jgi:hypothetical protein